MNRSGKGSGRRMRAPKIVRKNNQMEIPSTLDHLPKVNQFVERKLRKLGLNEDLIADIAISVTEAVTNAVVHGNKNDLSKKVKISLKANSSCVEVTVVDEGGGFDSEDLQSPIKKENLLKNAGRGIFILKSLMDQVNFSYRPRKGTEVKMIKFLI